MKFILLLILIILILLLNNNFKENYTLKNVSKKMKSVSSVSTSATNAINPLLKSLKKEGFSNSSNIKTKINATKLYYIWNNFSSDFSEKWKTYLRNKINNIDTVC